MKAHTRFAWIAIAVVLIALSHMPSSAYARDWSEWLEIGGRHSVFYVGGGELYVTHTRTADIYHSIGGSVFRKIGGPGRTFVVDAQGRLYGITPDGGAVATWSPANPIWTQIGGPADALYAGGSELYATQPRTGDIYRYGGSPFRWTKIGGPGKTFVVDGQGRLYGITPDGGAVATWSPANPIWTQIGGPANALYAGGNELYAIRPGTPQGDIYRYLQTPFQWSRLPPRPDATGDAFAVDGSGVLYTYGVVIGGLRVWSAAEGVWRWIDLEIGAAGVYPAPNGLYIKDDISSYQMGFPIVLFCSPAACSIFLNDTVG